MGNVSHPPRHIQRERSGGGRVRLAPGNKITDAGVISQLLNQHQDVVARGDQQRAHRSRLGYI